MFTIMVNITNCLKTLVFFLWCTVLHATSALLSREEGNPHHNRKWLSLGDIVAKCLHN